MSARLQSIETIALPAAPQQERLVSLDVFRGITLALMLLVNNPGAGEPYATLKHSIWNGWTSADLVFPCFIFIVGVAIPFSLAKRSTAEHQSTRRQLAHIWQRSLTLIVLGLLQQAIPHPGDHPPDGFLWFMAFRYFCLFFVYASLLALLVPQNSPRMEAWLSLSVLVALSLLAIAGHFANLHALNSGLPQDFKLGLGIHDPDRMRLPGILQRIGVCYGIAATIKLLRGWRTVLITSIVLLVVYSLLLFKAPFAGHVTGSLTFDDNFARSIDNAVFNRYTTAPDGSRRITQWHTYPYPDNEGILSTIPSIATALIGVLVGVWLKTDRSVRMRCAAILGVGMILALAGKGLDLWLMPINKILWTPSFVLFTAGLSMLGLGMIFGIVDLLGRRRWALPFVALGRNSIVVFILDSALPDLLAFKSVHPADSGSPVPIKSYIPQQIAAALHHFNGWLQNLSPHLPTIDSPANASLAYSVLFALTILLIVGVLHQRRIFVKI